ncbi:MFS transporter [Brachybacterium huguangmaarense]|uniref:MFS transporter n=1 Tax=Brachybacterium huguangmaarense TaxID=1652028 RepID=A0ABY6FZ96_9MICO|nr:MFS transporter [Brachybacterium huguangmaarense]UYG16140.1 MFS transporter [Brachybacterium huguangmaarense]
MRATRPPRASQTDRRARGAVSALFLTNGALYANILPRYPEIKNALGLDNTAYGLAVIAFPIGAILAGLGAASVIRRLGSGAAAVAGTILTSLGLLTAGFAPNVWLFALCLLVGGGFDAITDVAQNAHGLRVQRRYGRSIINSFHAVWSIGAVLGGAMAAAAIALDVPIGVHLTISAALFSVVSLTALRFCLTGRDGERDEEAVADAEERGTALRSGISWRIVLTLVALVVIAMAGTIVEDAGFTWATLYLTSLDAPGAIAATGLIALVGAQFIGRLLGDGMVDRFGQRAVARAGGAIAAVGMGLALAVPTVPGSILGFAAAGFGVATLVPAAMNQADDLPGLRHGTGLTVVSWLMRLGFLLSPPVVGMVADAAGLRAGLLAIPLAGVAVILLAGVLQPRRMRDRPRAQDAG